MYGYFYRPVECFFVKIQPVTNVQDTVNRKNAASYDGYQIEKISTT